MDPNQNVNQPDDPQANYAGFDPSTAEMHEGVPAFSDALDGENAPQGEAPEEQVDYRALYESAQQETAQERSARQQLEAQQQQLMFQASQAAWEQERQNAHAHANTLDYEQAQQHLANFYQQREQRLMGWAQQATQAVWINQHADQVIRQHGLSPDDRARLGNDPQQFAAVAQSISSERQRYTSELQDTKAQLKKMQQQLAANGALSNPAYRQGGARPNGAVPNQLVPGSVEKLAAILGMPAQPRR